MLLNCFVSGKATSFENLLEPFLKICRTSQSIAIGIAKAQFFQRLIDRLGHSRAVVRLNLLRILKQVCDVHPNRALLVERFGLYELVSKLSQEDGAVLVRELAREIKPALQPALKPALATREGALKHIIAPRSSSRRAASEASVPKLPGAAGTSYIAPRGQMGRTGRAPISPKSPRSKLRELQ